MIRDLGCTSASTCGFRFWEELLAQASSLDSTNTGYDAKIDRIHCLASIWTARAHAPIILE